MGNPLYMENPYMKEFEATVESRSDNAVILSDTAFSPRGGGLPSDKGVILKGGAKFEVTEAVKKDGKILHLLADPTGLETGDAVRGIIDWDRRYALMKMHTASHILASVLHRDHGALITGNQVDVEQSRMDFNVEAFDRNLMNAAVEKANGFISRNIELKVYSMEREKAMEIPGIVKIAKGLPEGIKVLRIVEIGDADIQADGGVHVARTGEIGKLVMMKLENKGKTNRRIYFTLAPP